MAVRTKPSEVNGQIRLTSRWESRIKQSHEKNRLEKNARQDISVRDPALHQRGDFPDADGLRLPDLLEPAAEKNDSDRFKHERDDEYDEKFAHL